MSVPKQNNDYSVHAKKRYVCLKIHKCKINVCSDERHIRKKWQNTGIGVVPPHTT